LLIIARHEIGGCCEGSKEQKVNKAQIEQKDECKEIVHVLSEILGLSYIIWTFCVGVGYSLVQNDCF